MRAHTALKCVALLIAAHLAQPAFSKECVILLHGLARTSNSMATLADSLEQHGFHVANTSYPSREKPIEELAALAVPRGLEACRAASATPVNFVTHSLGGILVRQYFKQNPLEDVHRVVMLGPPNHGSEAVDALRDIPGFELLNGPAGMQLGTDAEAIPAGLGPVEFQLGVIAGTRTINLLLSTLLPKPNDGKVSVESAKVDGMKDFIALPVSHPLMMRNDNVIAQVIHFLDTGHFNEP